MSVLVDTSVWVDHFKSSNDTLKYLLGMDLVFTHPMVIAELACGTPPSPRKKTLGDIGLLQPTKQAILVEVMGFIEHEKLYGLGCGFVDISLLASTLMTPGSKLWTLDKRLANLAERFNISYLSHLNAH